MALPEYLKEPVRDSFEREAAFGYECFLRYARHVRPRGIVADYEDIVQDALWTVFKRVRLTGMPDDRIGFRKLMSLAMNWALGKSQKFENAQKRRGHFALADLDAEVNPGAFFMASDSNPATTAYERELFANPLETFARAIRMAPKRVRGVISLYLESRTPEEIAEMKKLSLRSVRTYISDFSRDLRYYFKD